MGRFATSTPLYARFRQPYLPTFFGAVAERVGLDSQDGVIDLGCGPGLLALGFAPMAGLVVGVDPEPAILDEAREAAKAAGRTVAWIRSRTEELPPDLGSFRLVTIGRALHRMEREPTLSVLDRLVAPGGAIAVCGTGAPDAERPAWLEAFSAVRTAFAPDEPPGRFRLGLDAFFAGSRFAVRERVCVRMRHRLTADDLVRRALTFSSTSPQLLGDRQPAFERAIAEAVGPFLEDGTVTEEIEAHATLAA